MRYINLIILIFLISCSVDNAKNTDDIKNILENKSEKELVKLLKDKKDKKIDNTFSRISSKDLFNVIADKQISRYYSIYKPTITIVPDNSDYYSTNIDSVVCLVEKNKLQFDKKKNKYIMSTKKYEEYFGICKDSDFEEKTEYNNIVRDKLNEIRDQPVAPFCTGFFVDNDKIATAGHCIETNKDLENIYFVYGFKMTKEKKSIVEFESNSVFEGSEIINRKKCDYVDYALIKLKSKVTNKNCKIAKIEEKVEYNLNDDIYVIGHPSGLPLKVIKNGSIQKNSDDNYFVTNLDTFAGNSGSPVYNKKTNKVIGILVAGNEDFLPVGNCFKPILYEADQGGEICTKIKFISKYLNK